MPPFEASAETPAGQSFGKCHLSWKPARRSSPRKPLSTRLRNRPFGLSFGTCHVSRRLSRKLPRKPFEAAPRYLPDLPSEHATCFRVPSENPSSGSPPSRHVSRDSPRENPEYLPPAPNAPRGQQVIVFPGCLRLRLVSRVSPNHRPPGCRPAARESPPEDPPGHSVSAPRVNHPGSEPSVYYRKFQKMVVTSKIHRNSGLNRKNPKPIFTVSF